MAKWSINDLWGRLTQKKAMKPEVRDMLTSLDGVYEQLRAAGVPLKPDRDQCWRDFAGWRVNYDTVLVALASLVIAPEARWSSDRQAIGAMPSIIRRRRT